MTIEQIDSERMLIALCNEDMKSFSLEFESMTLSDPHVREIFQSLLNYASAETGISVKNKRMLIEAIPYKSGCLLLITLSQKKRERKIYRIKGIHPLIFSFEEVEDLLRCVCELYKINTRKAYSDVYKFGEKYIMSIRPHSQIPRHFSAMLSEYGKRISGGSLTLSKIREYGKLIAKDNAIESIGISISSNSETKH